MPRASVTAASSIRSRYPSTGSSDRSRTPSALVAEIAVGERGRDRVARRPQGEPELGLGARPELLGAAHEQREHGIQPARSRGVDPPPCDGGIVLAVDEDEDPHA